METTHNPQPWCNCGAKTMQGEHHRMRCPAHPHSHLNLVTDEERIREIIREEIRNLVYDSALVPEAKK